MMCRSWVCSLSDTEQLYGPCPPPLCPTHAPPGIVINSLDRVTEGEDMKMLASQARIIDEVESTMPA